MDHLLITHAQPLPSSQTTLDACTQNFPGVSILHWEWGRGGGRGERTARYFPKEGTPKLVQMVVTNIITACASPSQGFFPSIIISMKLVFLKSYIATVHPNAVRLRTAKTIGYRIIRRVVLVSDLLIKTLPVL